MSDRYYFSCRSNNMEHSAILRLKNITKSYGNKSTSSANGGQLVVDNVSLTLQHGELLGLLGPSGCGKTTLLRIIAGFESISQGTVEIAGKVVCTDCDSVATEKRNTGMVFQDYALFPHLTVEENVAFGLKNQKQNKGIFSNNKSFNNQVKQRVTEVLELVGLTSLQKRYPHQLSGGQQQRISLARALAPQPALILLDEPLSNLDVQVRHRLRAEIRAILKAAGTSAIFVTHDREEALAISDKIAVMRKGKLEQVDTPEEIYINPASRFVAEFVTQANFLPARKEGQFWVSEIAKIPIQIEATQSDRLELMVRQEDITMSVDPSSRIVIRERQFLGREYHYCIETASGKIIHARGDLSNAIAVGTRVNLSLDVASPRIFASKLKNEKPLAKIK